MSLSSLQLDAFFEVSRLKSFSKAAKYLFVTQSALSQRVAQLEEELGAMLLVREPSGLKLTEIGEELQQYCQGRMALETECVSRIKNAHEKSMAGVVRIGAYSTIARSVVLPSIAPLFKEHPHVRFEIMSRELRDLPSALKSGEVDYIFLDRALDGDRVESLFIGYEEYVLIEPKAMHVGNTYLDHDSEDQTSYRFFDLQAQKPQSISRSYLDDIYGIIDGVGFGLGKAVVPLHLVKDNRNVRCVPKLKPLIVPIFLSYCRRAVYTVLHKAVVRSFETEAGVKLWKCNSIAKTT